jgi:hypothetical protein
VRTILGVSYEIEGMFFTSETNGSKPADSLRAYLMGKSSEFRKDQGSYLELWIADLIDISDRNLPRDAEYALCFQIKEDLEDAFKEHTSTFDEITLRAYREQLEWLKSTTRQDDRSGDKLLEETRFDMRPSIGGHPRR